MRSKEALPNANLRLSLFADYLDCWCHSIFEDEALVLKLMVLVSPPILPKYIPLSFLGGRIIALAGLAEAGLADDLDPFYVVVTVFRVVAEVDDVRFCDDIPVVFDVVEGAMCDRISLLLFILL